MHGCSWCVHQVCVDKCFTGCVCPLYVHSEMVNSMNFQGKTVDEALRQFQSHFQISVSAIGSDSSDMNCPALCPSTCTSQGEAQKIERIVEVCVGACFAWAASVLVEVVLPPAGLCQRVPRGQPRPGHLCQLRHCVHPLLCHHDAQHRPPQPLCEEAPHKAGVDLHEQG